jgi:hypothetical protein
MGVSRRQAVASDLSGAARVAAIATLWFVVVEVALTLWRYAGDGPVLAKLRSIFVVETSAQARFLALALTLGLLLWLVTTAALLALGLGWRALDAGAQRGRSRPRGLRLAAWGVAALIGGAFIWRAALHVDLQFKQPMLRALLQATLALLALPMTWLVARGLGAPGVDGAARGALLARRDAHAPTPAGLWAWLIAALPSAAALYLLAGALFRSIGAPEVAALAFAGAALGVLASTWLAARGLGRRRRRRDRADAGRGLAARALATGVPGAVGHGARRPGRPGRGHAADPGHRAVAPAAGAHVLRPRRRHRLRQRGPVARAPPRPGGGPAARWRTPGRPGLGGAGPRPAWSRSPCSTSGPTPAPARSWSTARRRWPAWSRWCAASTTSTVTATARCSARTTAGR